MTCCCELQAEALNNLAEAINRLSQGVTFRHSKPGLIKLTVTSEGENGMFTFHLTLPTPGASDVTKRELSVQVGSQAPIVQEFEGTITEAGGFTGEQDDAVLVKLVDIDDVGNRSESREQSFTLTDTIAPPQPGEIGLTVDSET